MDSAIVVPKQFHISLLFLGLFDYVSNDISNYLQNFLVLTSILT
jgi:hypothetical protein